MFTITIKYCPVQISGHFHSSYIKAESAQAKRGGEVSLSKRIKYVNKVCPTLS